MSTDDLYVTYLYLPFRSSYEAYDDKMRGFNYMKNKFKCLSELFKREDAAEIIFQNYLEFQINETNNTDFSFQEFINLTGVLLFQPDILNQLSSEERKNIVRKTLEIFNQNIAFPNAPWTSYYYGLLIERILYAENYAPSVELVTGDDNTKKWFDLGWPVLGSWENQKSFAENYLNEITYVQEQPIPFSLLPAYPNPFNPITTISFTVPQSESVKLFIYTISGQKIDTLIDEPMSAGTHRVAFDAAGHPSGVYFARIEAGGMVETEKLLLVK